ncbi:hypothetical protein KI387_042425, partial [Taxus chinensis]
MALGSFGTCGTRMRETRGSADSGEAGKRRTNAFWDMRDKSAFGTCGKVREVRDSAGSDENVTTGP